MKKKRVKKVGKKSPVSLRSIVYELAKSSRANHGMIGEHSAQIGESKSEILRFFSEVKAIKLENDKVLVRLKRIEGALHSAACGIRGLQEVIGELQQAQNETRQRVEANRISNIEWTKECVAKELRESYLLRDFMTRCVKRLPLHRRLRNWFLSRCAIPFLILLLASVAFSDPRTVVEMGLRYSDGTTFVVPVPPATQPTTAPADPTILPPLAALPADAILIASDADLSKQSHYPAGATLAYARGQTLHEQDTFWLTQPVRLTSYGPVSSPLPILKWAHPTSATGDVIGSKSAGVQIDSLQIDGGGEASGVYLATGDLTMRNLVFSHIGSCAWGGGESSVCIMDHCAMPDIDGAHAYFVFGTLGKYRITNCVFAGSRDQHNVRVIGDYYGAHNDWTVANFKECLTVMGGTFTEEDSTIRSVQHFAYYLDAAGHKVFYASGSGMTFGPLLSQDFTVSKAIIRRCKFVNTNIKIVGNVGDVLLEDLTGSPKAGESMVWAGHGNGDTTRSIGSVTMNRFGGVVLPAGSKMFEQSINIGSVTDP